MIGELFTRTFSAIVLLGCFLGAYLHSTMLFSLLLFAALLIILVFEWPNLVDRKPFSLFIFISLLYPIAPMIGLILLNGWFRPIDLLFPLYPFIISWIYDTMGYMVGSLIGVHKICPSISPGKSWEGLLGSFVGVLLGNVVLLQRITIDPFNAFATQFKTLLMFSLAVTCIAFTGGMMISLLKRRKGLKDAGSLLPGHGGLLDRFDSIFFVGMLVWGILLTSEFLR